MRCTAKSKQSGQQCKRHATPGSTKCRMHGGKTPRGLAAPSFKTGRYSNYLPKGLTDAYARAQADTELLNNREDIMLIDSMIASALPKLESRESGKAWTLIKKAIGDMKAAFVDEQYGKAMAYLDVMVEIVNAEMLFYATEEEIRSALDQRRKLAESERKRLLEMQQTITAEQATVLVSALLDSVRRNVHDRDTLTAIQADFVSVATRQSSQRIDAGNED